MHIHDYSPTNNLNHTHILHDWSANDVRGYVCQHTYIHTYIHRSAIVQFQTRIILLTKTRFILSVTKCICAVQENVTQNVYVCLCVRLFAVICNTDEVV